LTVILEEVGWCQCLQASHAHVAGRLVGHLGLEGGPGGVKCAVGAQGAVKGREEVEEGTMSVVE